MNRYTGLILLALLASIAQAQTTTLRQSRIFAGDIAELTIVYESAIPSMYAVDTTQLKADFEVLDSRSRLSRVQRDQQSLHRMEWNLRLVPRRSGLIRIPALRFGEHYSEALQLTVEPVPESLQAAQNVFVELQAIPPDPYPGQQTRIVTRLYHNLPLQQAALGEPVTRLPVFRSGRDTQYQITRNGETFEVLERSVLLTAQGADELQIQAASFSGNIHAAGQPETTWLAGDTRYILRNSNTLRLQLRALPQGADTATWLPARQLELTLEWENWKDTLNPGDSLGVILDLQATGLPADALPANLLSRDSSQYRIYADHETRRTRVVEAVGDEHLVGQLRQRYVIIVDQTGEITLPALQLKWWDVEQDRARVAGFEAVTLKVSAPASAAERVRGSDLAAEGNTAIAAGLLPWRLRDVWPWLLAAAGSLLLAALAWFYRVSLLALYAQVRQRRRSRMALECACDNNDAPAARRGLIAWARLHWGDDQLSSLRQITCRRSALPDWRDELARLDAAIFAAERSAWDGQGVRRLVRKQRRNSTARRLPEGNYLDSYFSWSPSSDQPFAGLKRSPKRLS